MNSDLLLMSHKNDGRFYSNVDARDILAEEYEARRSRNRSYSIRSFARDISLSPGMVSGLLNKKKGLSSELARRLAGTLSFDSPQTAYFIDLAESKHGTSAQIRKRALERVSSYRQQEATELAVETNIDPFRKWYYSPILEMITVSKGATSPEKVAKQLGLSKSIVEGAFEALRNSGLISQDGSKWVRAQDHFYVHRPTPSKFLRAFHRTFLLKGAKEINFQPIEKRKFLTTVFAIERSKVTEARKFLEEVHSDFIKRFGTAESPDAVYVFSQQLYQLVSDHDADD